VLKSVPSSEYNREYFQGRYQNLSEEMLKDISRFERSHQKASSMIELGEDDTVVDLGCGTGQMPIFLYLKFSCNVIGIDYSEDAIRICEENKEKIVKKDSDSTKKIQFYRYDNDYLPEFHDIKAVFLIDVVEHLYDNELDLVLEKIKRWGKEIKIIVHTDNNYYLKYIRPMFDLLAVFLGRTTYRKLNEGHAEVSKRHVNLTNANRLKKKLALYGFEILRIDYPPINTAAIKDQLGSIADHRIVLYPILFLGKIFYFLRPSFYMLAEYRDSI